LEETKMILFVVMDFCCLVIVYDGFPFLNFITGRMNMLKERWI